MKKALLVGINYVGSGHELRGCINDSNNMKEYLTAQGFTQINQVLEENATTAGIIVGLKWLVADVVPGDVIVFHYSGHGSQLPSKAEADGFEEIICPIDLDWMKKIVSDATLRDIFDVVPNGVNTTVILDCCHSGTMLNQLESLNGDKEIVPTAETPDSRYWAPPANIAARLEDRTLVDWSTSKDVNATALLIAGCHANQTSADTVINGQPCGAATASLLHAVSTNPTITYRELIASMDNFMVIGKYEQVPELDGAPYLYDQKFIQPFDFTIPAGTVVAPVATPVVKKPVSQQNVVLVIVGIIIVLATLFVMNH